MHPTGRSASSWLDDLAVVIADWRARRPRARLLLVLFALVNWAPARAAEPFLLTCAVLAFAAPSYREGRGRGMQVLAIVVALVGAALSNQTEWGLDPERALGSIVLVAGTFLGARHGRWWPWLLPGALAGALHFPGWGWWFDFSVFFSLLLAVLAARVAAVPADADAADARDRLAVTLQRSPWRTSFAVCALAVIAPGQLAMVEGTALGLGLVALLFHATWRAGTLVDRASAWTAAVAVSPLVFGLGYATAVAQQAPIFGSALTWAFDPSLVAPLAVGVLAGRGAPVLRESGVGLRALGWLLLVHLLTAAGMTATWGHDFPVTPEGVALWRWGTIGLSVLWLVVFHRLATGPLPARRIVVGAILVGLAHAGVALLVGPEHVTYGWGALSPVGAWVGAALLALLARDVARVTRVPDEHPLIADWTRRVR